MAGSDAHSSAAGRRSRLIIGGWLVDPDRCTLQPEQVEDGPRESIRLSPRNMDVLLYLARHQGQVINSRQLLDTFWNPASAADHAVHNAIAALRSAFDDDPHHPRFIRTLPKRGYCLIADVQRVQERQGRYREAAPLLAGLATTVLLLVAGLSALGWVSATGGGTAFQTPVSGPGAHRLAVLSPRYGETVDTDTRRRVAALLDSLAVRLGQQPDLDVIVVDQPSGEGPTPLAGHLLKIRIYSTGDELRLTLNLTETGSGTSLYLDHFVLDEARLSAADSNVVPAVETALGIHLDSELRQRMLSLGTANAMAFRHYRQAEYLRGRNNHRDWRQAMAQYESAITRDPGFVRAYIGKAAAASEMAQYSRYQRGRALDDKILALGRRMTLEAQDSEALVRLRMMRMGMVGVDEWQQERICREWIRSGNAPEYVYTRYASFLAGARLYDEAGAYLRLAREQADEPMPAPAVQPLTAEQRAAEQLQQLSERPADIGLLGAAIRNLVYTGELEKARRLLDRQRQHDSDGIRAHLSRILVAARSGELSDSGEYEDLFHDRQLQDPDLAFNNAALFFLRGDFERGAGYWRELTPTDRHRLFTEWHTIEKHLPEDLLRDPRYTGLLEELGAGIDWQHHLMAGVRELAPYTGVSLDTDLAADRASAIR